MASKGERDVKGSEVLKETFKGQSTQMAEEEFAIMLSKLMALLSIKYSKHEELQQLLVKCMRLTVTNETPYVFLISSDQKVKFGSLNSIHDMFTFFKSQWSWCDFDLLKHIVKLSNVTEASQLLGTYDYMTEWKLDLRKEDKTGVSSQAMSYLFCRVEIVVDESCDHLSKQKYEDLKSKLLDYGRVQNYSVYFNGEAFQPLLKLFLYIPINAAKSMTRALEQSKRELSEERFVFIKVGDTVLFDNTGSQSKEGVFEVKADVPQVSRSDDHSNAPYELTMAKSFSLVDVEAKVVLLGALGVGKTSITLRYIGDLFSHDVNPTIAASFFSFTVNVGQSKVKFQLWDTAGQERFRSMLPMYYRRANAAIIVYDVTSEESFAQVTEWIKELQKSTNSEVALCIVGNKIDLQDKVKVSTERGQRLANSFNAAFTESSAKQNIGIHDMFHKTAVQIVDLKQKKLHKNLILNENVEFSNFGQPFVVIGHRSVTTEPSSPAPLPSEKPKRKCCPW